VPEVPAVPPVPDAGDWKLPMDTWSKNLTLLAIYNRIYIINILKNLFITIYITHF